MVGPLPIEKCPGCPYNTPGKETNVETVSLYSEYHHRPISRFFRCLQRNNLAPASLAPTESRAIAPIPLASPASITPVVTPELSPVQTTPIHPATTPLPATPI